MKYSLILLLWIIMSLNACKTSKVHFLTNENNTQIDIRGKRASTTVFKGNIKELYGEENIAFASIDFYDSKGVNRGTTTDSLGNFLIKDIPLGDCQMHIEAPGFQDLKCKFTISEHGYFTCKFRLKMITIEKPVIYLYPTEKQIIEARLLYKGRLTHTYPQYPKDGWKVTAAPDGTIWDKNGMEYYALFWEGVPHQFIVPEDGFVVEGKASAAFLEEKLAYLGLNRREANEFIMYWLPRLESNPYNLIHFASKQYDEQAELLITPKPDCIIRVMMLTQPLQTHRPFPLQDLSGLKKERKGFTVVEWGGSVIQSIPENN